MCSASYPTGTSVTPTATPANTNRDVFAGWSRGGCSDATPTCTVALTQPIRADKRWTYRHLYPVIRLSRNSGGAPVGTPCMRENRVRSLALDFKAMARTRVNRTDAE